MDAADLQARAIAPAAVTGLTVGDVPRPRASSEGRRVVILSSVFPYPADGGNKVVLSGLVRYFTSRPFTTLHYVLVGEPTGQAPSDVVLHAVPRPGRLTGVVSLVRHAVLGRYSLQESLLRSAEVGDRLREVLAGIGPELIVVDTVRMGQYLAELDLPGTTTVCYVDDLYSDRYEAMLALRRAEPDVELHPLASFTERIPRSLRWLTEWGPTQRAILTFEARRVRRSELRTAFEFDRCLLVNGNEADLLRRRAAEAAPRWPAFPRQPAQVSVIRPRSQAAMAAGPVRREYRGGAGFLFLGVLSSPHNDIALRWLLTEVLPRLREVDPDVRIDVAGRGASAALTELAEATPGVRMLGFVPDLEPLLASTCAVLNPPPFASGIKLKLLDALAAGVPVVSTLPGAGGVVDGPGQGVLVADTPEEFGAMMTRLRDPAYNAVVAREAREHHESWFSEESLFPHYDRVLRVGVGSIGATPETP